MCLTSEKQFPNRQAACDANKPAEPVNSHTPGSDANDKYDKEQNTGDFGENVFRHAFKKFLHFFRLHVRIFLPARRRGEVGIPPRRLLGNLTIESYQRRNQVDYRYYEIFVLYTPSKELARQLLNFL